MIVTVTPSPGLDLTYVLAGSLAADTSEVVRSREAGLEASGKGVNVSRALAAAGVPTIAVLPVGGSLGRHLLDLLDAERVPHRAVETGAPTRVNTTLLEPGGRTLKVNAPSPPLAPAEADGLVAAAAAALASGERGEAETWLVVSGSVPEPAAALVARLVATAHAAGARCAVDSSGPALRGAVAAGADLVAPNLGELADLLGTDVAALDPARPETIAGPAAELARVTGGELLVSLGEHGALWTDGEEARLAAGPAAVPVNTAGAGDALLSGYLAGPLPRPREARQDNVAVRLARAAAWGTATVLSPTTVAGAARLRDADHSGTAAVHVQPVAWAGTGNDRLARNSSPGSSPGGERPGGSA